MGPGDRLPSIALERAEGDGTVNLRHGGRDATVIVRLPATDTARFRQYVERLTGAAPAFHDWSGRLLAVLDDASGAPDASSSVPSFAVPVLRDTAQVTRDWAPAVEAAVIIADRYGVVYHEAHGPNEADLPDTDQVVEWLRYLATQCPECGVPDEPGLGEYA